MHTRTRNFTEVCWMNSKIAINISGWDWIIPESHVNTIAADALDPCVARSSETMSQSV